MRPDRIPQAARDSGVPVREDKALVQVLSALRIDQEIPPELSSAIFAFLHRANAPQA